MEKKDKTVNGRTVFELLSCIKEKKIRWQDLPDIDKKKFSPFLINRLLSMNMELLPIINILQKYTIGLLKPKEVYKIYLDFLPKEKTFDKYIKGKKDNKYNDELLQYLSKWYGVSQREVIDYLELLPKDEVITILKKYGLTDKESKKLLK